MYKLVIAACIAAIIALFAAPVVSSRKPAFDAGKLVGDYGNYRIVAQQPK